MGTELKLNQKWEHNFLKVTGRVTNFTLTSVTLDVTYSSGEVRPHTASKTNMSQYWTLVEDAMVIEVDDKFVPRSAPTANPITIIWAKEDGSKFLVAGVQSEWLLDRETIEKHWEKVVPEVLPDNVRRVNVVTPDNSWREEVVELTNVTTLNKNTVDVVVNSRNMLLIAKDGSNSYFSISLSPQQLEFLLAEHKKHYIG